MRILLTFLSLGIAVSALAEVRPLDDYKTIVDRHPFGRPPEDFDPTAAPDARTAAGGRGGAAEAEVPLTQQQEDLRKNVTASIIHINPQTNVPWLGFTDLTDPKAPVSHFVAEGSGEGGWLVKGIDFETKTATLVKGEVEIEVVVGAPAKGKEPVDAKRPAGASATPGRSSAPPPVFRSTLTGRSLPSAAASAEGQIESKKSRFRQRIEAEEQQKRQAELDRQASLDAAARRQREEFDRQRAEERAARDAERQADQEEYRQRLKNIADEVERRMEANRQGSAEEGAENE